MYGSNNEVAGGGRPGADWGDGTSSAVQPPNPDTADTPPPLLHLHQHMQHLPRNLENKIMIHQTFNTWGCHVVYVMFHVWYTFI